MTERYEKSFFPFCIKNWNSLDESTKSLLSISRFKFNCASPTCKYGIEDETPVHYFSCCPRYNAIRLTFLSRISDIIGTDVNVLPNEHFFKILSYGSNSFNDVSNKLIISETIQYIRKSRRFMILEAYS